MQRYKNLEEIVKLCENELQNNDKNVSAVLDLEDLKELRKLLLDYKELVAFAAGKSIQELGMSDLYKIK